MGSERLSATGEGLEDRGPRSPCIAGGRILEAYRVEVTLCFWVEGHEMSGLLGLPGWAEGVGEVNPHEFCWGAAADRFNAPPPLGTVSTRPSFSHSWVGWLVLFLSMPFGGFGLQPSAEPRAGHMGGKGKTLGLTWDGVIRVPRFLAGSSSSHLSESFEIAQ